jgi:hypothetical protein
VLAAAMPNTRLIRSSCRASGHVIHHAKPELVIGEIDAIAAR